MAKTTEKHNLIGERIRTIRKSKEITLIDLAKKSGVQQATLSRIETGIMKGTVACHQRIAETLGISLAELYSDVDARLTEIIHSPKKAHTQTSRKNNRVNYEILVHQGSQKKLLPALISLEEGGETDRERTNRGVEKFLWVLDGKVEVQIEKQKYQLGKGDSLYFDASIPHTVRHLSGSPARLLSVTSPPTV